MANPISEHPLLSVIVGALLAVFLGLAATEGCRMIKEQQPPRVVAVNQAPQGGIALGVQNPPGGIEHRIYAAFLQVEEVVREPMKAAAPITIDEVVFRSEDRRPDGYFKRIAAIKLPKDEQATILVRVVDPERRGLVIHGTLRLWHTADGSKLAFRPIPCTIQIE